MGVPYGDDAAWIGHAFLYSATDDGTEGPTPEERDEPSSPALLRRPGQPPVTA
jgi:hypothetical protein